MAKQFIPFYNYGKFSIHIDLEAMVVVAARNFTDITHTFQAKSEKQAWFAYHNPEKVDGLLKNVAY